MNKFNSGMLINFIHFFKDLPLLYMLQSTIKTAIEQ